VGVSAESASTLHVGELEIRLGEGLVLATGRALTLSVREFELLVAMATRAGAIVTRQDLYSEVWGGTLRPGDRSVDVYVSKLRGKLETALPDRRFIHTHPGFGYRFQPQPSHDGAAGTGSEAPDGATPHTQAPDPAGQAAEAAASADGDRLLRNVHIGAAED
jgi:DNA-binding winged helix-turn-helix (wHTH) protein